MQKTDITSKIFAATEMLMAKHGIHNLCMQKIAKSANVSVGTIYLYFENKQDLLEKLTCHIFNTFQQVLCKNFDIGMPILCLYKQMWLNIWEFLKTNPQMLMNLHSYQTLPQLPEIYKQSQNNPNNAWNSFCNKGIKSGELIDLPHLVLWNLSLRTSVSLALDCSLNSFTISNQMIDNVINRSFIAISNHNGIEENL